MWLSEALAGWRDRYPDIAVHPEVIRERRKRMSVVTRRAAELRIQVKGAPEQVLNPA